MYSVSRYRTVLNFGEFIYTYCNTVKGPLQDIKLRREMIKMMICTPYITLRNGKRLFAHEKGLEAFCFEVTPEQNKKYMEKKAKEKAKEKKKAANEKQEE